jgi:hypothetical protein
MSTSPATFAEFLKFFVDQMNDVDNESMMPDISDDHLIQILLGVIKPFADKNGVELPEYFEDLLKDEDCENEDSDDE